MFQNRAHVCCLPALLSAFPVQFCYARTAPSKAAPLPPPGRQGVHMHSVRSTTAAPGDEPALTLFIHGGVRRMPHGRPLLHVSCVDHDRAMRLYPNPASRRAPVARCERACQTETERDLA